MKNVYRAAATAIALIAATGVAQAEPGKIQVKLMGSGVLPNGEISSIEYVNTAVFTGPLAVTTAPQTKANDNVVPTLAIEYFVTPNISLETICCFTQHDVDFTAGTLGTATNLAGGEAVSNALILPATLTAKYHLNAGGIKPYLGAGISYFVFIDEKPGATVAGLGVDKLRLDDKIGFALQGGVDVPLNEKMGISLDAKKYFQKTTAHFFVGNTEILTTKHKLDPWVLSAGVSYRF